MIRRTDLGGQKRGWGWRLAWWFGVHVPASLTAATINADPTSYLPLLPTLQPGDTLALASGSYMSDLQLSGLNGTAGAWITISGPSDGSARFLGDVDHNTVELLNCSFVAICNLTLDGQHLDGPFGVSAKDGTANLTHDILIQDLTILDYDATQQADGISTKCPTWNWTIRGNRIIGAGTGLYLGSPDGTDPFVHGLIEGNLVENPIGYDMEIKWQLPRPSIAGMPTAPGSTIIRNNVFIKNDQTSPDGDRPNLLVGGFPASGDGAQDRYEIAGNLFDHNPRESLLQVSGRVSIHDNLFIDVALRALYCADQDLPLDLVHIYNNTILSAGTGIDFGNAAHVADAVIGNLVFATTAFNGPIATMQGNLTDSVANAGAYLTNPSPVLGTVDAYPLAGTCTGPALDLSVCSDDWAYTLDFNGMSKGSLTYRGAYAGSGQNPGWRPVADLMPIPAEGAGDGTVGSTSGTGAGSGTSTGTVTGSGTSTGTGSVTGTGTTTGTTVAPTASSGSGGCGLGGGVALVISAISLGRLRRRSVHP
jgi:hypothetical protein